MRAILCFFVFVAVVGAGLSGEISKHFAKPGGHGAVAMAVPSRDASPKQTAIGGRTVTQHGRNVWTMTPVPVPGGVALLAMRTGNN